MTKLDIPYVEHHEERNVLTKGDVKKVDDDEECHTLKEGLHSRQFYLLLFMVIMAACNSILSTGANFDAY